MNGHPKDYKIVKFVMFHQGFPSGFLLVVNCFHTVTSNNLSNSSLTFKIDVNTFKHVNALHRSDLNNPIIEMYLKSVRPKQGASCRGSGCLGFDPELEQHKREKV